ncbi:MAG: M15 family metallopeptidase [Beijerinckiaceae bacterium]|nr:M15 family metallopeptidase [Beijerinckiaceae bacterium]
MNAQALLQPPTGFVRLRDVAPAIAQDVRYAGSDNFTGAPAPGYEAADCWLLAPVALALAGVAQDAAREGLQIIVWDGYRPQRASDYFLLWSQTEDASPSAARLRAAYHPNIDKLDLFARGFLSRRSSHSRGSAVDLGLLDASGALLEFGTGFDFFDDLSGIDCLVVTEAAQANRRLLRRLMEARGFKNYPPEWWHFSFPVADDTQLLDAPIR